MLLEILFLIEELSYYSVLVTHAKVETSLNCIKYTAQTLAACSSHKGMVNLQAQIKIITIA